MRKPRPISRPLRTHDLARALGVHVNTIRLYEADGYLPPIPRSNNGYREYSLLHLEQARLTYIALRYPYIGDKDRLIELVKNAASGDLGMAMELAYQHLAHVRVERTIAESAVEFLERWAAGYRVEMPRQRVHIRQAAKQLNVTVDTLRSWERNGLIDIPRDPDNRYRLYGTAEFGRLRVIRTLMQAGYSQMAILNMLIAFDKGKTDNLRAALDLPPEDDVFQIISDRWLSSLNALEERAQAIIRLLGHLIEMAHNAKPYTMPPPP